MNNSLGLHINHCCKEHGCKYNDPDCPVVNGRAEQVYLCEQCEVKSGRVRSDKPNKSNKPKYVKPLGRIRTFFDKLSKMHDGMDELIQLNKDLLKESEKINNQISRYLKAYNIK